MKTRAAAAARTRAGIVEASIALYYDGAGARSTLEQIAGRAGVTVQTVLRHFGSRAALGEIAREEALRRVREERRTPPGDPDRAVEAVFDHYELRGRSVLSLLAQETLTGEPDLSGGRREHRRWVAEVFEPQLAGYAPDRRQELIEELVVTTDVYTWKLLRVDGRLNRPRAEGRVREMIAALLGTAGEQHGE